MAAQTSQNYANHVRKLPRVFLACFVILGVNVLWCSYNAFRNFGPWTAFQVFLAAALFVLFFYARTFALTVQDRVIRLEERMRLERLLPVEFRPRIGEFTVKQLVAMRFASDAELPELARQVIKGQLSEPDAIKRAVKEWRADWQRT